VRPAGKPLSGSYDLLLPSRRLRAPDAVRMAVTAERLGWRGVWASEVLSLDALVLAGAIILSTRGVRVGTAVVPITTRSPTLLAMAAATLAQLAPGRFHLGVGLSTPVIVDERHGRPVTKPVHEARAAVRIIRSALRGERVSNEERPRVTDLRIDAPEEPPAVHLAALGPRMTQTAIDCADGMMLNLATADDAAHRAAQARARTPGFETFLLVRACVEPTADDRGVLRKEVAGYARVPVYQEQFARAGHDLRAAAAAPNLAAAAAALPDDLLDAVTVTGSAEECRGRLDALVAAGVTPLVVPVGRSVAVERTLTTLAPA
jgi:probable F420-dependent oxidoreductase